MGKKDFEQGLVIGMQLSGGSATPTTDEFGSTEVSIGGFTLSLESALKVNDRQTHVLVFNGLQWVLEPMSNMGFFDNDSIDIGNISINREQTLAKTIITSSIINQLDYVDTDYLFGDITFMNVDLPNSNTSRGALNNPFIFPGLPASPKSSILSPYQCISELDNKVYLYTSDNELCMTGTGSIRSSTTITVYSLNKLDTIPTWSSYTSGSSVSLSGSIIKSTCSIYKNNTFLSALYTPDLSVRYSGYYNLPYQLITSNPNLFMSDSPFYIDDSSVSAGLKMKTDGVCLKTSLNSLAIRWLEPIPVTGTLNTFLTGPIVAASTHDVYGTSGAKYIVRRI